MASFLRESGIEVALDHKGAKGKRILTIFRTEAHSTAATATTATQNPSEPQSQSLADPPAGGGSNGPAVQPPPVPQPPPSGAALNSLKKQDESLTGGGGGEDGGDLHLGSNGAFNQINLCRQCGPVDWQWVNGNWICPKCGAPAGVKRPGDIERIEI